MATVAYSLNTECSSNTHFEINAVYNGVTTVTVNTYVDELRDALSSLTADEREKIALVICRIHLAGMTRAQARNALISGFTVTI